MSIRRHLLAHFGQGIAEELEALRLAFTEALVNAIKHAHGEDGRPLQIALQLEAEEVIFRIYDSGPGFDWPEARLELPDLDAESGRGLFLIQSVMTDAQYHRQPGHNLLYMRYAVVAAGAATIPTVQDAARRILVAESNEQLRTLIRLMLRSTGAQVSTARDGVEALNLLRSDDGFDAAIIDYALPKMSGPEVIQRYRATPQRAFTPLLMCTASDDPARIVEGYDAGADDCFVKPPKIKVLHARLRAVYRMRDMAMALQQSAHGLQEQLREARSLQMSMLPDEQMELPGAHLSSLFIPADLVSGDMLGYFALDEHRVAIYVADVSGHGVSAAMFSVWLHRMLLPHNGLTDGPEVSPAAVCAGIDRSMQDDDSEQYLTMTFLVLDTRTGALTYCSAGHPPPIVIRQDGHLRALEGSSPPIGMGLDFAFEDRIAQLEPFERLIAYSDCALEAARTNGEQFGEERLAETLVMACGADQLKQLDSVVTALRNFTEGAALDDDLSLVSVQLAGDYDEHHGGKGCGEGSHHAQRSVRCGGHEGSPGDLLEPVG